MNCDDCEHKFYGINGFRGRVYLCDLGGCEEHPANGGHPLSPCVQNRCMDDEEPDCYTDEIAIMEGNRCGFYIGWLEMMGKQRMKSNGCTYPFCKDCKDRIGGNDVDWICGRKGWDYENYQVSIVTEEEYKRTHKLCRTNG